MLNNIRKETKITKSVMEDEYNRMTYPPEKEKLRKFIDETKDEDILVHVEVDNLGPLCGEAWAAYERTTPEGELSRYILYYMMS